MSYCRSIIVVISNLTWLLVTSISKFAFHFQEAAVTPPQTPYQAPKRTKMSREDLSSQVSKGCVT